MTKVHTLDGLRPTKRHLGVPTAPPFTCPMPRKRSRAALGLNARFDALIHHASDASKHRSIPQAPGSGGLTRSKIESCRQPDDESRSDGSCIGDNFSLIKYKKSRPNCLPGSSEPLNSSSETVTLVEIPDWLTATFTSLPPSHPLHRDSRLEAHIPAPEPTRTPTASDNCTFHTSTSQERTSPVTPVLHNSDRSVDYLHSGSAHSGIDIEYLRSISPSAIPFCSPGPASKPSLIPTIHTASPFIKTHHFSPSMSDASSPVRFPITRSLSSCVSAREVQSQFDHTHHSLPTQDPASGPLTFENSSSTPARLPHSQSGSVVLHHPVPKRPSPEGAYLGSLDVDGSNKAQSSEPELPSTLLVDIMENGALCGGLARESPVASPSMVTKSLDEEQFLDDCEGSDCSEIQVPGLANAISHPPLSTLGQTGPVLRYIRPHYLEEQPQALMAPPCDGDIYNAKLIAFASTASPEISNASLFSSITSKPFSKALLACEDSTQHSIQQPFEPGVVFTNSCSLPPHSNPTDSNFTMKEATVADAEDDLFEELFDELEQEDSRLQSDLTSAFDPLRGLESYG